MANTTTHSNLSEALRAAMNAYPEEDTDDVTPALRNAANVLDERRHASDDTNVLADELLKVSKAEMAVGPLSLPDRVQEAAATRNAQISYLRKVSPAAADAAEAARAA
jgi:thioredoxin-like negative regulator of GroEL